MLDAVIIVLRETLEASLLVGFLFVYSNYFVVNKKWMFWALLAGLLLSVLVALEMPGISDWFDGVGQELLFFIVLFSLSLLILWANMLLLLPNHLKRSKQIIKVIYSSIIVLAISLEGAEIMIFFQSSFRSANSVYSHLVGSLLGLGIGISAGAVGFYFLNQLSQLGVTVCLFLLTLVSAGMASQAVSYLIQADLLEGGYSIWDSSSIIDERSVVGQLFYALIGYEATPTLSQVVVYAIYIIIPVVIFIYSRTKQTA